MVKLKCEWYCNDCQEDTVQTWEGIDNHERWMFKCSKCGLKHVLDYPIVEWIE